MQKRYSIIKMSKEYSYEKFKEMKRQKEGAVQDYALNAGNLYDMNKQLFKQIGKALNDLELGGVQHKLEDWFNWQIDGYAMLLCHELRDYTIFHLYEKENKNPPAVAAKELILCLKNRGEILSIEETQDGANAWEIWLKINDEPYCYYLFNYDEGVIEV